MLKDTFCSSPWFHIRINPQGNYLPCRWASQQEKTSHNISNTSISEYMNSSTMSDLRSDMLNGNSPAICSTCYYEDRQNKVSGRQKQLLKSSIKLDNFNQSFCASPHWARFAYSADHQGLTDQQAVDLQIDLGNTCNSACVMCVPTYSSKLATDYIKLNEINPKLFADYPKLVNWADDPGLVDKFIDEVIQIPNLRYIHFLGGETLYLKSFYDICSKLIATGLGKNISIGTTTNGTVYIPQLENIIKEFKHVHLGISVEAFHPINDYIRYPSNISQVTDNIKKFLDLRKRTNLHVSLRITPSVLSIFHLDTVFKFMLDHGVTAESCDILHEPSCLRIELLPKILCRETISRIDQVISDYGLMQPEDTIINRRREDLTTSVISSVIFEYKNFLSSFDSPENVDEERYNLVKFLQAFETIRNNNILMYLPNYEEFLRSYGY